MKVRLMSLFTGALIGLLTQGAAAEKSGELLAERVGGSYGDVYKVVDQEAGVVCYVVTSQFNSSLVPSISCLKTDQRL